MAHAALASSTAPPGASAADGAAGSGAGGPGGRGLPFPSAEAGLQRAQTIQAVKQILLEEVEGKVSEKLEEVMLRGQQTMLQAHKRQQEHAESVSAEIARCLERQRDLELENQQFKQVIGQLTERLKILAPVLAAAAGRGPVAAAPAEAEPPAGLATVLEPAPYAECGASRHLEASGAADPAAPTSLSLEPLLPEFPFSSQTAAPLSLMEALQGSPAAAAPAAAAAAAALQHLGPPPGMPVALSLAATLPPSEHTFSFHIRKADETDLGLNVSHEAPSRVLLVEGIRAGGAVDAWNRQCMGGANPEKVVTVGDKIICVNGVADEPEKMLQECKERQLLRLTIFRGEMPSLTASGQAAAAAVERPPPSTPAPAAAMRAEAAAFVPGTTSAAEALPAAAAAAMVAQALGRGS